MVGKPSFYWQLESTNRSSDAAVLTETANIDENEARGLVQQVEERGCNPPRREKILEWQEQQDIPICPNLDEPDVCNVYNDLTFPGEVYEEIQGYREQR